MRFVTLFIGFFCSLIWVGSLHAAGFMGAEQITRDLLPRQTVNTMKIQPGTRSLGIVAAPVNSTGSGKGKTNLCVNFELNSAILTNDAKRQLAELAKSITSERLSDFRFDIIGHTDASGDAGLNQALSEKRAVAVKDYLAFAHAVQAQRLTTFGYGETKLRWPDKPYDAENRRVEIITRY